MSGNDHNKEPPVGPIEDPMAVVRDETKQKILHTLTIFPFVSGSMIQVGIGPAHPSKLWRNCLEELMKDGIVLMTSRQAVSPGGRATVYHVYHLSTNPYHYATSSSTPDPDTDSELVAVA
jgi:hypothetical protein